MWAIGSSCQARLGETIEQCEARYGNYTAWENPPPTWIKDFDIQFYKNGVRVFASFLNGTVGAEEYRSGASADFTEDEIAKILTLESAGMKWKPIDKNSWIRSDGAVAQHVDFVHTIFIISDVYIKATSQITGPKKLDGF
ncbi:MAG: hypothetical protein LV479_12470 [Methylacidiphilales bacterium]|nr:hypothetical protein [Candidatus Methylacidiphilales bacterium]